jgi:hypothetical protein
MNPHQHLIVPGGRLLDLFESKDIGRAILEIDSSFHLS